MVIPSSYRPQAGFSLLELIVVLVIMSSVSAVALPNLVNLYASVTASVERDSILDQIGGMGERALLDQTAYVLLSSRHNLEIEITEDPSLAQFHSFPIEFPHGWTIILDEPLIARANGVCLGGFITLFHNQEEDIRIELVPPFCNVTP